MPTKTLTKNLNPTAATAETALQEGRRKRTKVDRKVPLAPASPLPAHSDDPRVELRRLCFEHANHTRRKVSLISMQADKTRKLPRSSTEMLLRPQGGAVATADLSVGDLVKWGSSEATVSGVNKTTVTISIPCTLPADIRAMMVGVADSIEHHLTALEKEIARELVKFPVFNLFLSKAFGVGPGVIAGYLLAFVDVVHGGRDGVPTRGGESRPAADPRLTTVSQVVRYCGWAVMNGRLERRTKGVKLGYNAAIRMRLFQWLTMSVKNLGKRTRCADHNTAWKATSSLDDKAKETRKAEILAETANCAECLATEAPFGWTTKYKAVYDAARADLRANPNYDDKANTLNGEKGARMKAMQRGRARAITLFIEDFYLIARAEAGLPVSPARYARKLGYEHGGAVKAKGPILISVEQALELVGDVGKYPAKEDVGDEAE